MFNGIVDLLLLWMMHWAKGVLHCYVNYLQNEHYFSSLITNAVLVQIQVSNVALPLQSRKAWLLAVMYVYQQVRK